MYVGAFSDYFYVFPRALYPEFCDILNFPAKINALKNKQISVQVPFPVTSAAYNCIDI